MPNNLQTSITASGNNLPDKKQVRTPLVKAHSLLAYKGVKQPVMRPQLHQCQSCPVQAAQRRVPCTFTVLTPSCCTLHTTQSAAQLGYKGNLTENHTLLLPAYVCGGSLTPFCQTDCDQLACAVTKAYLNPDHFPKHH